MQFVKGQTTKDDGYKVQVNFRYHKVTAKLGALVVPTLLPAEWGEVVEDWLKQNPSEYLFPIKDWKTAMEDLLQALRKVNSSWELRCLRRGSLCTMARAGVPYETLKLFSLHTNDLMMTRYLRGGLHAGERTQRCQAAAKHLHPPAEEKLTQ